MERVIIISTDPCFRGAVVASPFSSLEYSINENQMPFFSDLTLLLTNLPPDELKHLTCFFPLAALRLFVLSLEELILCFG